MRGVDWIMDGGALSVDFVNTLRDRWSDVPRETLPTSRSMIGWMQSAGVAVSSSADADYSTALALRGALEALFEHRASAAEIALINDLSRDAPRATLVGAGTDITAKIDAPASFRGALGQIAADAVTLATNGLLPRVTVCHHERCGLLFVDTSRGRRRQWCSMQRCGNRAKVARFQERHR
ncbi:CGNR zinc finger domain-containing protein [Microbacterium sp. USHLN186]|uniref:CGNR zinc finger domain-containing protein n=1 Tax=Microbacterium sp. USHLN186 TaxID=3081286 RepID=UPI0030195A6E